MLASFTRRVAGQALARGSRVTQSLERQLGLALLTHGDAVVGINLSVRIDTVSRLDTGENFQTRAQLSDERVEVGRLRRRLIRESRLTPDEQQDLRAASISSGYLNQVSR